MKNAILIVGDQAYSLDPFNQLYTTNVTQDHDANTMTFAVPITRVDPRQDNVIDQVLIDHVQHSLEIIRTLLAAKMEREDDRR